jgi:uncharacterized membrane protein YczE
MRISTPVSPQFTGNKALGRKPWSELHYSLSLQCGDSASKCRAGNLTERCAINVCVRIREFCVVKHVESLHAKFYAHPLCDRGGFG